MSVPDLISDVAAKLQLHRFEQNKYQPQWLAWHQALHAAGVLYFAFFAHQASQRAAQPGLPAKEGVADNPAKVARSAKSANEAKAVFMSFPQSPKGASSWINGDVFAKPELGRRSPPTTSTE